MAFEHFLPYLPQTARRNPVGRGPQWLCRHQSRGYNWSLRPALRYKENRGKNVKLRKPSSDSLTCSLNLQPFQSRFGFLILPDFSQRIIVLGVIPIRSASSVIVKRPFIFSALFSVSWFLLIVSIISS